jgi:group I intron endonuclease
LSSDLNGIKAIFVARSIYVIVQRSVTKHGLNLFAFEIIEQVEEDLLTEREQYWIDHYRELGILYNTCLIAGSALGTIHSAETREKISASKASWAKRKGERS